MVSNSLDMELQELLDMLGVYRGTLVRSEYRNSVEPSRRSGRCEVKSCSGQVTGAVPRQA
jgi:hypothetical protein